MRYAMTGSVKPAMWLLLLSLVACTDDYNKSDHNPSSRSEAIVGDTIETKVQAQASSVDPDQSKDAITTYAGVIRDTSSPELLALSPEEAVWLDEHGYPTVEELEALPTYDVEKLEEAMREHGNGKAAALLGHRRAQEGDLIGATSAFARGASLGSIYAREQLAIAGLQQATGLPEDSLSTAFDPAQMAVFVAEMEVARMLGDHRVDYYIDRYASSLDRSAYSDDILRHATEFMRQYGADAQVRNAQIRGPDPRPNAELWENLDAAAPTATITVYQRPGTYP